MNPGLKTSCIKILVSLKFWFHHWEFRCQSSLFKTVLLMEEKPETQEGDINLMTHIQPGKFFLVPHGAK